MALKKIRKLQQSRTNAVASKPAERGKLMIDLLEDRWVPTGPVPAPDGLVSWWAAEGNAADVASRNPGSLQNGTDFSTGMVGQAFHFDGINDLVSIPDAPNLTPQQLTIEAWVNPTYPMASFGTVVMKTSMASWTDGYGMSQDGPALTFWVNQYSLHRVKASLPTNTWSHVAGTYDGNSLRFYVNGALVDTAAYAGTINYAPAPLQIGSGPLNNTWKGSIDELSLYNRALSATEIAAIAGAGSAGKILDQAPVARAGGPYTAPEGGAVTLDASATTDPDAGDVLTYQWDLDGDGVFGETGAAAGRGAEVGPTPTFSAAGLDGPSTFNVQLRVTDQAGLVSTDAAAIQIANVAPQDVFAGNDQTVVLGSAVHLTGSFTDPGPDSHTEEWTAWDSQGTFVGGAKGANFDFTPATSGTFTVCYAVTDDDGGMGSARLHVTVAAAVNTAPVLGPIATNAASIGQVAEGQTVTLAAPFSDADAGDHHTAQIDWGDNTTTLATIQENNGSGILNGTHTYASGGRYPIAVTLLDTALAADHGGSVAFVTGAGIHAGVLEIVGTAKRDEVAVTDGSHQSLVVRANFLSGTPSRSYPASAVTSLLILLGDGNDVASVGTGVRQRALLDGGAGNDVLTAGGGSSILLGGSGDDILTGGPQRDLLIGGAGRDCLFGRGGEDLLIGGTTSLDETALNAVLNEWTSNHSRAQRIRNLRGDVTSPSFAQRNNGNAFLRAGGADATVFDDQAIDFLFGASSNDWIFSHEHRAHRHNH